ncbi:MAG: nickel insertion protein, partial [Desulfobaccales bacterium]
MSTLTTSERWAFFDCFAGISGDMTLGALIDLGLEVSDLEGLLNLLGLAEVSLSAPRRTKDHLSGVQLQVDLRSRRPQPTRS